MEWHERGTRPQANGLYIAQSVFGDVSTFGFTAEGGWNTFVDSVGTLHAEHAISDGCIARWMEMPKGLPVPREWIDEYMREDL